VDYVEFRTRETGRCFANVIIEPGSAYEDEEGPKINRFRYTFVKQKAAATFSLPSRR
jgi:DNA replication ATP-dependent helicase Dna2